MKQINLVLGILVVIGGLCYDTIAHNLLMKGCASFGFVLLGVINLLYGNREKWGGRSFAVILVIGLLVGMAADIVLEINFMLGALVFAVGHVFYIIAYSRLYAFRVKDLIPATVLFTAITAIILFLPIFDFGGMVMKVVCIVYAAIIGVMVGKAFSNYKASSKVLTKILAVGSALFLFSDVMLLFSNFAQVPDIVGSLCVNTYYPAQAILAYSLMCMEEK